MSIRAITFDFWSTLFRDANGPARQRMRVAALVEATGVVEEAADAALQTAWAEFARSHRKDQRTLDAMDAVRVAASELGVSLPPDAAEELAKVFATAILQHSPEPIEGALEAVRVASARGPVGVISDSGVSPGAALRALLERHGFLEYLDGAVFSDEMGVSKPHAAMFERAAGDLAVQPRDLLHLGGLEYTDVAGARGVGAKAGLYAGCNTEFLHQTKADYTLTHWNQFVDLIEGLQ